MEKRALISVFDKSGIADFARELVKMNWELWASGGTFKAIRQADIPVNNIESLVGPPILGHRIVTLTKQVNAGLVADLDSASHLKDLEDNELLAFHMVVCDFYPLHRATDKPGATVDEVIALTDIGGPTMVAAAAKGNRIVVCRPQDRNTVLAFLQQLGYVPDTCMKQLRFQAFEQVYLYYQKAAQFHRKVAFSAATTSIEEDMAQML